MTALLAIEDFLLSSDARLIRVIDIYKSIPVYTVPNGFDIFRIGHYRNVSYSELRDELNSHPWFKALAKND